MKLESRGGEKSTALILKAMNGEENIALNIEDGDIIVKGQKGYTNTHEISNHRITIINGIITNIEYTG